MHILHLNQPVMTDHIGQGRSGRDEQETNYQNITWKHVNKKSSPKKCFHFYQVPGM